VANIWREPPALEPSPARFRVAGAHHQHDAIEIAGWHAHAFLALYDPRCCVDPCLAVGAELARENERPVGAEDGGVLCGDGPEDHRPQGRRRLGVLTEEATAADPLGRIVQALESGDAICDGLDFQAVTVAIVPTVADAPLGRSRLQAVLDAD